MPGIHPECEFLFTSEVGALLASRAARVLPLSHAFRFQRNHIAAIAL
jgi:hypothetical protein